jgi:hypothetical protein
MCSQPIEVTSDDFDGPRVGTQGSTDAASSPTARALTNAFLIAPG